jgi:hypothetical protein
MKEVQRLPANNYVLLSYWMLIRIIFKRQRPYKIVVLLYSRQF